MIKKLVNKYCFILLIIVISGCTQYQFENSLKQIIDQGVIRVGSLYGSTSYYNGAFTTEGFEYELAKGFADYLGVKLEVYPYHSFDELEQQLAEGRLDLIAANVTMTDDHKNVYTFGPAYQSTVFELVYKKGEVRPRDFSQLEGTLKITDNTLYREALKDAQTSYDLEWIETNEKDVEELLEMVSIGKLDYTISDSNILNIARRRYPNLGIGFSVTDTLQVGWVLDSGSDDSLRAALIEYFGTMQKNGQLSALEDRYFGHVRTFDFVDTRAFMRAVNNNLPKYKEMFITHAGDIDWRLIAAIAYQESHWDPEAVSPTGVRGLMMLTRGTARDMGLTDRTDPEQSISGGSRYFATLLRRIPARIKAPDRIWMAMAAYNVGLGHLEDARRLTETAGYNPDLWIDVKKHLPLLRQKKFYQDTRYGYARGDEAVNYVENIRRYYDSIVFLESEASPLDDNISPTNADQAAPPPINAD